MKIKRTIAIICSVFLASVSVFIAVAVLNSGMFTGKTGSDISRTAVQEGRFFDRNGSEITSFPGEKGDSNTCNFISCSPLIGYNSERLYLSGLRSRYKEYLFSDSYGDTGCDIQMTVDAQLNDKIYHIMKEKGIKGSCSVIDAGTGEVKALVSITDTEIPYDVNLIDESTTVNGKTIYYSDVYNNIKNCYYNLALLAQDPPGSTAKVITTFCAVKNSTTDIIYDDTGSITIDGETIKNAAGGVYGKIDLQAALNDSVNCYFANLGLELGDYSLRKTFGNFFVGSEYKIDLDFGTIKSNYSNSSYISDFTLACNAFGQGDLVISPFHLAMIQCAMVNKGVMMRPYMVKNVYSPEGKTLLTTTDTPLAICTDEKTAETVKGMMHNVAEHYKATNGSFGNSLSDEIYLCMKTGSAETYDGSGHTYVTFAIEANGRSYGCCLDRIDAGDTWGVDLLPVTEQVINAVVRSIPAE